VSLLVYWGIIVFATVAVAQQPDSIGRVMALTGQATVQHTGSAQAVPLTMLSPLYQGDLIRTQAAAKVRMALVDGTTLALGEQSTVRISDFVYAPAQQTRKSLLTVVEGIFRVLTTVLPGSTFEVHTTNAVAAVRGTDWLGQVQRDATAMVVLQGDVEVTQARLEVQGSVRLTAGLGTDVLGQQPPTPPKPWGAARVQALLTATTLP
jgi:hypothetical protein